MIFLRKSCLNDSIPIIYFLFGTHLGKNMHSEADFDRVLLRIMHLYEEGEDLELSKPVIINLKVRTSTEL